MKPDASQGGPESAPCRFCDLSLDCAEHGLVIIPASGMLYSGLPYPVVARAFLGVFPADD